MTIALREARDAFETVAADLSAFLDARTDEDLLARSRCRGWVVADVLAHLHLGLSEMITGFAYRVDAPPDTDFLTYWSGYPEPDPDAAVGQIRFARLLASAYGRPTGLLDHFRPTLEAVRRFVAQADDGCVRFQGHVLPLGDFVATWVVEIVVHHLDVLVELPGPTPDLTLAVRTLDGLRGEGDRPADWDDVTYVLAGSGRIPGPKGYPLLG
ncbi:maleylpyruvate isomerase N-terminal domain-containing protein [Cryptosporangium japonicum]|uniref:Maleylpyruvate isomerase N-terminal domain-containing protein n=1 Tax=Cryptosporangium japonicum TaxID=80872 RepID=A0ABN0USR5_9ACTN